MTTPSLPDALATIARLDGVMRPAAEAADQRQWEHLRPDFGTSSIWPAGEDVGAVAIRCDYENAAHIAATCPASFLAYSDATATLAKHAVAETKRADAAERELEEQRNELYRLKTVFCRLVERADTAEAALATAQETIARLTAALANVLPTAARNEAGAEVDNAAQLLADLRPADATEADRGE